MTNTKISLKGFKVLCAAFLRYREDLEDIRVEWVTGGRGGGSCYGGEHYSLDSEPEPEFEDLDIPLEVFNPTITYLQYKKLTRDVLGIGERRNNDYYGNYTVYGVKKIYLDKLYSYLDSTGGLDNLLIFITGLPGSGKTTLAKKLGGDLYDDPTDEQIIGLSDRRLGPLTVISDPRLIRADARENAVKRIALPESKIIWIFFENDPDPCIRNVRKRKDGQPVEPKAIEGMSKKYQIPEGTKTLNVGWY